MPYKTLRDLIAFVLYFYLLSGAVWALEESRTALSRLADNVKPYVLENGLRVLIYERKVSPVFSAHLAVKAGALDEDPGETGIAHVFEHMAFKGTSSIGATDYKKEERLLEELEVIAEDSNAAQNLSQEQKARWEEIHAELATLWTGRTLDSEYEQRGAVGLNAATGVDLTMYFVSFPKTAFEAWCRLESERLLDPVFRQFYQERDVILEERRMRFEDDPDGKLHENLLQVAFLHHQFRRPLIGYETDLRQLTASKVARFYRQFYVPSNMTLALVGDLDPDESIGTVKRWFGRLPRRSPPVRSYLPEPVQQGERQFVIYAKATPRVTIAYHKPVFPDPDDAPLSLLAEILAGSRLSPLYRKLVKERRLAVGVSNSETPGQRHPNLLTFDITPRNPHSNAENLDTFDKVLADFVRRGPTDRELDRAKRSIAMSYLNSLERNASLARTLAGLEVLYGDWKSTLIWYDQVMQAKGADVKRVAEGYLRTTNRTIGRLEGEG